MAENGEQASAQAAAAQQPEEEKKHDVDYADEESKQAVSEIQEVGISKKIDASSG